MCLDYRWSDENIKKWLDTQPDIVTGYKMVRIKNGKMYSPFQRGRLKKKNKISLWFDPIYELIIREPRRAARTHLLEKDEPTKGIGFPYHIAENSTYIAYYHCFEDKEQAESFATAETEFVVKVEIPKKDITDIGVQWNGVTIVSKSFDIPDIKGILKNHYK